LTLSTPEKVIQVHDDTDPKKAFVLKVIDVSAAGAVLRMSQDYMPTQMIVCTSEEGDVYWYNMQDAKEISNSSLCAVNHNQSSFCCKYFSDAPLIVSADAEGCALFWSLPPLRTYDFFNKVTLNLAGSEGGTAGITSLSLSWPDETKMYVGTDRGGLACVDISRVVESAKCQQKEILLRKESGEAEDVISGRIFDTMPRPSDHPDYVFELENIWFVEKAHNGSVDSMICCKRSPAVLITLGADACVRIWDNETGAALGCLEQGLPEGLAYERETDWSFPLDPHLQIEDDIEQLSKAAEIEQEDAEFKQQLPEQTATQMKAEEAKLVKAVGPPKQEKDVLQQLKPKKSSSSPALAAGHSRSVAGSSMMLSPDYPDWSKAMPRYLEPTTVYGGGDPKDFYAGPAAPGFGTEKGMSLPRLQSGMMRPPAAKTRKVLEAARALAVSLGDVRNSKDYSYGN